MRYTARSGGTTSQRGWPCTSGLLFLRPLSSLRAVLVHLLYAPRWTSSPQEAAGWNAIDLTGDSDFLCAPRCEVVGGEPILHAFFHHRLCRWSSVSVLVLSPVLVRRGCIEKHVERTNTLQGGIPYPRETEEEVILRSSASPAGLRATTTRISQRRCWHGLRPLMGRSPSLCCHGMGRAATPGGYEQPQEHLRATDEAPGTCVADTGVCSVATLQTWNQATMQWIRRVSEISPEATAARATQRHLTRLRRRLHPWGPSDQKRPTGQRARGHRGHLRFTAARPG
jgi:hypothetical protein